MSELMKIVELVNGSKKEIVEKCNFLDGLDIPHGDTLGNLCRAFVVSKTVLAKVKRLKAFKDNSIFGVPLMLKL